VKDSTDDLWFLESTTDDDSECDKQSSDGSVFANELDLVSDADDVADNGSDNESILPDEVSNVLCDTNHTISTTFGYCLTGLVIWSCSRLVPNSTTWTTAVTDTTNGQTYNKLYR